MGMVYYVEECEPFINASSTPLDDTITMLKALYVKKTVFQKRAKHVINFDEIKEETEDNTVTLQLGSTRYRCDEYTYYNPIKRKFYDHKMNALETKQLSLQKYMSYSRPLKRGADGRKAEKDGSIYNGYYGRNLNYLGSLIRILKDLPSGTLIQCNKKVDPAIVDLFRIYRDYNPAIRAFFNEYHMYGYEEAEEYERLKDPAKAIEDICNIKDIYFDINPYASIIMHKEPFEAWINNKEMGAYDGDYRNARYYFTKYEDTYIDGHIDYHEETKPVGMLETKCIHEEQHYAGSIKYLRIVRTYEITYEDGVKGRAYKESTEKNPCWD